MTWATGNAVTNTTMNEYVQQVILADIGLSSWQAFFLILGVSLVLAKIIQEVGSRIAQRLVSRSEGTLGDIVFKETHTPLYITVAVIGVYVAILALGLPQPANFGVRAVSLSAITAIWARALIRVGREFFAHLKESDGGHRDFAYIFENIWTFLVIVTTLFLFMAIWRVDITPLLASAGVAGVVIGFAAKDAVANLFGGFALYFDDTYTIGDYIVLDSGDEGTVVDIGIRSTSIVTRDDVMIQVPNAVLNSSQVINQSSPRERKRISIPVGIAYGTDLDRFEEIVLDIAKEQDLVLDHPSPRMRFREFGDSALLYDLLCWVDAPLKDVKATHELNREIHSALNEADITIPFPQRDVHMKEE